MTPINHLFWFPFRGPLGSSPHSLLSTSKNMSNAFCLVRFALSAGDACTSHDHFASGAPQNNGAIALSSRTPNKWRIGATRGERIADPMFYDTGGLFRQESEL